MRGGVQELRQQRRRFLRRELERLKRRLIALGAEKIILFGSMARGEVGMFSDIDLLVVMPSPLPFVERLAQVYRRVLPRGADLFVYTPEEFDRMSQTNPFIRQALKEGQVLYEKVP